MATPETLPAKRAISRREVIATARTWLGVPYRHLGRTRSGVDCAGFILAVAEDLGIKTHAPSDYSNQPKGTTLLVPAEAQMWRMERTRIIPGDVVVFWAWTPEEPSHFGIIGEGPHGVTTIHSFSKYGKVVEQKWNRFWADHFVGIYNLPGTAAEFV